MYFVGNSKTFYASKTWFPLLNGLENDVDSVCVGTGLPLICPRHRSCRRLAEHAAHIPIDVSLCGEICRIPMDCGVYLFKALSRRS